jgi:predicted nucleic acid-binding protein
LYAESSAVLRWLLATPDAPALQDELESATEVVTSAVTSAEVARTLHRLAASQQLDGTARARVWARYARVAAHWHLYSVSQTVLDDAAATLPVEPIRTLDAIHVVTAVRYAREVTPVTVLSVDRRLRDNAAALGLAVTPALDDAR